MDRSIKLAQRLKVEGFDWGAPEIGVSIAIDQDTQQAFPDDDGFGQSYMDCAKPKLDDVVKHFKSRRRAATHE